ncbi:hypothetical protein C3L33_14842, partial [Rhododendron williamsianum]
MVQAKVEETYYISHGAPTLSIDDSLPARGFLKSFRDTVYGGAQRPPPTSILVISGHWETDYPTVNAVSGTCDTIYDFYGFPQEMYKVLQYLLFLGLVFLVVRARRFVVRRNRCFKFAMGSEPHVPLFLLIPKAQVSDTGSSTISDKGERITNGIWVPTGEVDKKRGLDHGAWVPLMLMFPEADIPVCQLSVQTNRDGTYHYNLGKALAPLKEEGVLIIGSGSATHNLRAPRLTDGSVASWALELILGSKTPFSMEGMKISITTKREHPCKSGTPVARPLLSIACSHWRRGMAITEWGKEALDLNYVEEILLQEEFSQVQKKASDSMIWKGILKPCCGDLRRCHPNQGFVGFEILLQILVALFVGILKRVFKANFDAAFSGGKMAIAVVVRDYTSAIVWAKTLVGNSSSPSLQKLKQPECLASGLIKSLGMLSL